jgi:hypothetical protein
MKLYIVWQETSEQEDVPIAFFLNHENAIKEVDKNPEYRFIQETETDD